MTAVYYIKQQVLNFLGALVWLAVVAAMVIGLVLLVLEVRYLAHKHLQPRPEPTGGCGYSICIQCSNYKK